MRGTSFDFGRAGKSFKFIVDLNSENSALQLRRTLGVLVPV
jgi:hypothetical protein